MYSIGTNFVVFSKAEYLWLMKHLEDLGYIWNSGHRPTHYNFDSAYYTKKRLYINEIGCISFGHSESKRVIVVSSLTNLKRPSIFKSTFSNPKSIEYITIMDGK